MFRKVLLLLLVVVIGHALLQASGAGVVVVSIVAWALVGYVAWRAYPAVRADVARLCGRWFGRRGDRLETF